MALFYKIAENTYLPCREDNSLRVGFEPFKNEMKNPLDGIDSGLCSAGGVMNVDGQSFFYCKSNEYEGYYSKRSSKPVNTTSKIPQWLM